MARVTIERSLEKCESRFELVVLTSYRAHAIANGSQTAVNTDNKFAVVALREIEAGKIDMDELKKTVLEKYALDSKINASTNAFIIDDHSVRLGDVNENDEDEKSNDKSNHSSLNVDKDFFA